MATAPYGFVSSRTLSGYDPVIAREQLQMIQMLANVHGRPMFCRLFLMILGKKEQRAEHGTSRIIPFVLSRIQRDLQDKKGKRNITLKPRQIGSTTWHILCRLFLPAILEPGSSGLLISQTKPYGAQHFRIMQRALKNFATAPLWVASSTDPELHLADSLQKNLLHTQYSARHEILFDFLDSKILVDSAENADAGTGLTITHLVATEVAYWKRDPESLLAQAKEAIPAGGTMDLESTPNGMGGYFFEEWQRSKQPNSEFKGHFYPWWWQAEYKEEPATEKDELTEEERKMAKEFLWSMKQVTWRRNKVISLRHKFPEKYPEDAITCFLTSGDTFFDRDILRWLKIKLEGEVPLDTYNSGALKFYKRRVKGRRYIIGADVAEGKLVSTDNSDYSAAVVIDMDTGEEMAGYRSKMPPEEFAKDLYDLAKMYNDAMLCVERVGPGGSVILELQRQLLYGNIYYHKEWFKEQKKVVFVAGFPTNLRTRPIALNKLGEMIRNAPEFWHDKTFVDEALTFVWTAKNRSQQRTMLPGQTINFGARIPQGAQGCHDDTVMCRAIASYCRLVSLGYLDPLETPSERYGDTGEDTAEEAA